MSKQVLCFGEVLWDTFEDGKKIGGAPLNVAQHLTQQGIPTYIVSRVGADASGDELLLELQKANVPLQYIQRDRHLPTCEVTVSLDASGQATYTIPQPVAWDNIQPTDELLNDAGQLAAIVFGSLASREQATRTTLLNLLSEFTIPLRVFDVNLRPPHYDLDTIETLAALANVVKMNEDEANLLIHSTHGSLKDKMVEFHKKFHSNTICVTRGQNGAIIWHDEEFYEHPGFEVQVEDTVGAGDSFLATLVAGLLLAQPIPQILEKACKIGAFVASQRGANPVYPDNLF
ncbi:carbohydrate kinase [Mucilaginibacter sp. PAMB04274]|uniref:carbohydrate kinase family protein n=1 Tax=Mucilaginibacter sp. PAMB04274 TaxID=3138568 RepID=UPI0031F6A966